MKHLLIIPVSLTLVLFFAIHAVYADKVEVEVHGIACSFCAYGLEKKIKKMKGVSNIDVDVRTGKVVIDVEEGMSLDRDELAKAVRDAGLSVKTDTILPGREGSVDQAQPQYGEKN